MLAAPLLLLLALQAVPASQEFERGKIAFERREFGRAIDILRPLLYPVPRLDSEGELVQAHRMLGIAHLFEQQNERAGEEFRKLLQLRPDYPMDPLLDPPQVVDFFNGVRKQQEAELAELDRRRREAEAEERRRIEAAKNGPLILERRFVRNSFAINFLPFGAGQFQNGHRGKGWFFLTSQSVLAGASIAAFTTNFALYGLRPRRKCIEATGLATPPAGMGGGNINDPVSSAGCPAGTMPSPDEARSRTIRNVQVATGGLFFAVALWGVVDAIVHYQPEVALVATPPPPPRREAAALRLLPSLFEGGGLGGSLAFRF